MDATAKLEETCFYIKTYLEHIFGEWVVNQIAEGSEVYGYGHIAIRTYVRTFCKNNYFEFRLPQNGYVHLKLKIDFFLGLLYFINTIIVY